MNLYRASSVVLKLRSDKLAGGLGLVVAADPRLGVPLELRKGGRYGCAYNHLVANCRGKTGFRTNQLGTTKPGRGASDQATEDGLGLRTLGDSSRKRKLAQRRCRSRLSKLTPGPPYSALMVTDVSFTRAALAGATACTSIINNLAHHPTVQHGARISRS